jgi:hypothetical protein
MFLNLYTLTLPHNGFHSCVPQHNRTIGNWVPSMINRKFESRIRKRYAKLFDKAIGNTLWLDAIQKRYKNERLH